MRYRTEIQSPRGGECRQALLPISILLLELRMKNSSDKQAGESKDEESLDQTADQQVDQAADESSEAT